MVTRTTYPEIDWSTFPEDDGEPMAETSPNVIQMIDLQFALQTLFDIQGRAAHTTVGGNQLMYYNERDGRDHVSPDVYVILDRRPPAPPSWRTWVEGKFPDIVFEISSPSTADEDLSLAPKGKRRLYAELGVREYYVYDPQQEMEPPFLGFELRGGRLEPLPLSASGGIMSRLLGTELRPLTMGETERRPAGTWLRIVDPRNGRPLPTSEEVQRDFEATQRDAERLRHDLATSRRELETARQEVAASRQEVATAQRDSTQLRGDFAAMQRDFEQIRRDFTAMQERMAQEEQARRAAEQRAAQAESALHTDPARHAAHGSGPPSEYLSRGNVMFIPRAGTMNH